MSLWCSCSVEFVVFVVVLSFFFFVCGDNVVYLELLLFFCGRLSGSVF